MDETTNEIGIALLRGVNVGGKNKLPMKELAAIFVALGCHDVRTYIQSGNVVFRAAPAIWEALPGLVTHALRERLGLDVPLVVRTLARWRRVVEENPFLAGDADRAKLHVAFLADEPAAARVAKLDPDRSPPDELAARGGEVYLHCPNGMARTKITTAYLDGTLGTTSTVRNWNTVTALLALAEGLRGA